MRRILLTDISVRQLRLPDRGQVTYWDTTLPTFGVRVSQGGSKTFLVMKSNRRHTIGKHGVITLQQARKRARKLLAEATLGTLEPAGVPFNLLLEEFLDNRRRYTRATTFKTLHRLLEVHFSHFGNRPLHSIAPQDIAAVLGGLADTPSEANHAYAAGHQLFQYALRLRYIQFNPVASLDRPAPIGKRSHLPTDDDVRAILSTSFAPPFGAYMHLLFITGLRRNTLLYLCREHVNASEQLFNIPANLCKNNTVYNAPYGSLTAAILSTLPLCGLLFPSRYDESKPFSGFSKYKAHFDRLAKVQGYTLHDARRYFSSAHARLGTAMAVTELLLHHTSGQLSGVAGIYNRYSYLAEMRAAVARYDEHLQSVLSGPQRSPTIGAPVG